MSKNIVIQEGGVGRQFTADKLKTALVGGGSCNWVPEDETQLGTKHITEDGTYDATDDGYYGYSQVTVSGIGRAVGTDPSTGEQVQVTTNPETGNIEVKEIPTSIKITQEPIKKTYTDGELIDFTGLEVTLKSKKGETFTNEDYPSGKIPGAQLVFPVKTAIYDASSDGTARSEYAGNFQQPIAFHQGTTVATRHYSEPWEYWYNEWLIDSGNPRIFARITSSAYIVYHVSDEPFSWTLYNVTKRIGDKDEEWQLVTSRGGSSRTIHGKTVYVSEYTYTRTSGNATIEVPIYEVTPNDNDFYTLAYGEITASNTQKIPVTWLSQYDGVEYSDSFEITVNPQEEPTEEQPEQP